MLFWMVSWLAVILNDQLTWCCSEWSLDWLWFLMINWLDVVLNAEIVALLQEMGGYYIVNGQEKVIRMLILPRRNYVSFQPKDTQCLWVGRGTVVSVSCSCHTGTTWISNQKTRSVYLSLVTVIQELCEFPTKRHTVFVGWERYSRVCHLLL